MSIIPLITTAEADVYLALSAEWLALEPAQKEAYIYNSTLYMQARWTCTDVDWADPESLDDDLSRACALYAEADRIGCLFDAMEVQDPHGKKTMEKRVLDTMEKTTQWSMFGSVVNGNPVDSIDTLMGLYCSRITCSPTLIRV